MALLKFEAPKELAPLRVKIARPVQERVERYREIFAARSNSPISSSARSST